MKRIIVFSLAVLMAGEILIGQDLKSMSISKDQGIAVSGFINDLGAVTPVNVPLISFRLGETLVDSRQMNFISQGDSLIARMGDKIELVFAEDEGFTPGWKGTVTLKNLTKKDTLEVWNIVPFGEDPTRIYITGLGRHRLSRTHLFRPGLEPVNVIVPDNAWNLGFSELTDGSTNICALSRRTANSKAQIKRFENMLVPGSSVTYTLYADYYQGAWQEGLRLMFQSRLLYDLPAFDNTLYEREDLKWIRHTYASHLMYNWDHQYYDAKELKYNLEDFIQRGQTLYGGDDFIGIWPTWPTLGLDQRNQWDLFRDLPGGLEQLASIAEMCRSYGSKFFICYNPWDEDTRSENHYKGMAEMVGKIGADGVVLDTKGSSSLELQKAADSVRPGVIMYSEGMAVPQDMPGIVSGRVHNALYYPPMLNLNKLIKPDFAIYRVAEIYMEPIRREYSTSMFNGYGTELNIMKPGHPDWIDEDYRYFGKTLRILRENTSNFVQYDFVPLINTLKDKVYVNEWPLGDKTVYTVFSLIPEGFEGPLFEGASKEGFHWIDAWEHRELTPVKVDGTEYVPVRTEAFHKSWMGTNNEGAVSAVIRFPSLLKVDLNIDTLRISAPKGQEIRIWAGDPGYEKSPVVYDIAPRTIKLGEVFGRFEGDFVIQLFENNEILDERIVNIKSGEARMISQVERTPKMKEVPKGMVAIPSGAFTWKTTHGDDFISYPADPFKGPVNIAGFLMDKYPVTNKEYYQFVKSANYQPTDTVNYLKHWVNGKPLKTDENKPVVYVSYEDAKAYAAWAGKRLSTELEWQYAAQTTDLRAWPWGSDKGLIKEKEWVTNTLTVERIKGVDSAYCNPGNGRLEVVGKHPKGANPYGLEDLVGSVWQLTNDEYDNGSNYYVIMKGGSYFNPGSSWWYVQGGPRELTYRQMLLRVSRGFERNATVGFRCVADK